jgi:3D (Asp-Asp-Asp) domain-containing protein
MGNYFDKYDASGEADAADPSAAAHPVPSQQGNYFDKYDAQASPTPYTTYSRSAKSNGGVGDEMSDPDTDAGRTATGKNLTPGVAAVNTDVFPLGTIFKDPTSGRAYLAADVHGNRNHHVVDLYTPPDQYSGESGHKHLLVIGQIPRSQIPKTADGIQKMLMGYHDGSVDQGPIIDVSADGKSTLRNENADWVNGQLTINRSFTPPANPSPDSQNLPAAPSAGGNYFDKYDVPLKPNATGLENPAQPDPTPERPGWITLPQISPQEGGFPAQSSPTPAQRQVQPPQFQEDAGASQSAPSSSGNYFDQYDNPPSDLQAPASGPPPSGNYFDQFDNQAATSQQLQTLGAQYQQQSAQRTGQPAAQLTAPQLEDLGRQAQRLQQASMIQQLQNDGFQVDDNGRVLPRSTPGNVINSMAGSAVDNTLSAIQGLLTEQSKVAAWAGADGFAQRSNQQASQLADLRQAYAEVYKQDPSFSNSFTGHLTSAIGGAVPQFLEAVTPGGVLAMQSSGFQNAWDDARQSAERNGTEFNPTKAFWYAQAMGAVNAIAQKAKFDAAFKGWLAKGGGSVLGQSLRHGLLAAGMGAVITPTQTIAQNIAARYMGIDPHRQLLDPKNLGEQALIGALLGLPMGAVGGASHALEQGAKLRTLQGAASLKNLQIHGTNVDPALIHAAFGGGEEGGADSRFAPKEALEHVENTTNHPLAASRPLGPIRIRDAAHLGEVVAQVSRGELPRNQDIQIGHTPSVLRKLKAPDVWMNTSTSIIEKALKKHKMSQAEVVDALARLQDPMLVVKNYSTDGRGHVVMFPGSVTKGNPVAVSIEFNKIQQRIRVNDISTIHGADDFNQKFPSMEVYYQHPTKGEGWLRELSDRDALVKSKSDVPGVMSQPSVEGQSRELVGPSNIPGMMDQPSEGKIGVDSGVVKSQPIFDSAEGGSQGSSSPDPSTVRSIVDKVTGSWTNAPHVLVIDDVNKLSSYYDPLTMASIRNGKTEAFYDPNAHAVVMLPENFQPAPGESMESFVTRKIIHEIVGHAGLRGLFRGELAGQYDAIMGHAFDHLSGQDFGANHGDLHGYRSLADLARGYGFDLSTAEGRAATVEEHMARVAETANPPAWYHRVIAALSDLIRKMGFTHWTDSDTHMLLEQARNQVAGLSEPAAQSKIQFSKVIDEAKDSPEKQRGFIASAKANDTVLPTVKDRLQGVYRPISNAETVEAARQAINTRGIDGTLAELLGNKAPSATDYAAGIEMISRLQAAGRHEDTAALIEHMATSATDQGRAIQSLSLLSKLTPEGIQVYAQRLINSVIDKTPGLKDAATAVGGLREKLTQARHGEATAALVNLQDRISDMLGMKNPGSLWGRYKDQAVGQLESKLLPGAPNAPVPLQDFTARLTKMLREQMPPSGPRAQRPQLSDAELIGEAVRNFDKYKEVWTAAQDAIRQKYGSDVGALGSMDDFLGQILDKPFSDASVTRAAQAALKDLNLTMRQVLTQSVGDKAKTLAALKSAIIKKANLSGPDADRLAKEVQAAFQREHQAARDSLLKQMLADRSNAIPRSALEKLMGLNNAGALDDTRFYGALAKQYGIPTWTPELSAKVQRLQSEYERATDPEMKLVKGAQMFDAVHSLVPPDVFARLRATQNIAMLLNPKTVIRIIGGNTVLWAADMGADAVSRWVVDPMVSIATNNRTRTSVDVAQRLQGLAQPVKDFWNGYRFAQEGGANRSASIAEGVRTLVTLSHLTARGHMQLTDIRGGVQHAFSSEAGRLMEDALTVAHGVGPRAFWAAAFKADLARQIKLSADRGESLVAPTPEMITEATQTAARAVFLDPNFISEGMRGIQKGLNKLSTLGASSRYGIGSNVMPFTQVPGAIAMRGIEWSPLGFIRNAYEGIKPVLGKGPFDQKAFVDSFSRASLGTAGLALGYYLAKIGIMTALQEEDKNVAAMQQQAGIGKFRLNASALQRSIVTGNWITPQKVQDGDITVNYDWLGPNVMAIAGGAQIAHQEEINKHNAAQGKASKVLGDAMTGIVAGTQTLQDQPLLSGLSEYMKQMSENGIGGGTAITLMKSPSAFIPTFVSQVNQLMSNQVRETQAGSPWDKAVAQMMTKIPGLSDRYPAKYDAFGQALEKYQYGGNSLFNVLVNPAFVDKVNMTPALREVQRVYAATGDARITPPQAPVKLNLAGQQVELTNQQISQYQQTSGNLILKIYTRLAASPQFADASMLAKSEAMAKVVSYVGVATKMKVLKGNPDLIKTLRTEALGKRDAMKGLNQLH